MRVRMNPAWAFVVACVAPVAIPAYAGEVDEFYQSCEADNHGVAAHQVVATSFDCFVQVDARPDGYDLIVDVTAKPSTQTSYLTDAHKISFNQLLHKRWMKGKRVLILDEGYSVLESARRCARLQDAGLTQARILLGGLRAYLDEVTPQEIPSLAMLTPAQVMGPLEKSRMRLIMLSEFATADGVDVDWRRARRRIDELAPSFQAQQFMPVLVVGSEDDYRLLERLRPMPWWVYFLEGGEDAYQTSLSRHQAMVAGRHVRLRKCAAR